MLLCIIFYFFFFLSLCPVMIRGSFVGLPAIPEWSLWGKFTGTSSEIKILPWVIITFWSIRCIHMVPTYQRIEWQEKYSRSKRSAQASSCLLINFCISNDGRFCYGQSCYHENQEPTKKKNPLLRCCWERNSLIHHAKIPSTHCGDILMCSVKPSWSPACRVWKMPYAITVNLFSGGHFQKLIW
jgi:hypothetical protein